MMRHQKQPDGSPIPVTSSADLTTSEMIGLIVAFFVVAYFIAHWIG